MSPIVSRVASSVVPRVMPRTASSPWGNDTEPHEGRREFKHVLPRTSGNQARALVAARVSALRTEYPPRQVTSLYFDSARYLCYQQSNAGESERVKMRLRWYGALGPSTHLVLELKHRANHLGWKTTYPLGELDLTNMPLTDLPRRFAELVRPAERPLVEALRIPVLVTSYQRHYFATVDGGIRVTVDSDLRFLDQRRRPRLNLTFDGVRGDFAVVECKMAPAREGEASRMMRLLPCRHTRFSKYCHGLGCVSQG